MSTSIRMLRATVAASLLVACSSAFANTPAAPSPDDETIAALQSAFVRSVAPGEQAEQYRELVATVMRRVKRHFAREVDLRTVASTATRSMESFPAGAADPAEVFKKSMNDALRALDPHSRYLDPRAYGDERTESTVGFGGLGLEVQSSEGAIRVVAPMPDSPAARAGVVPGDLIVRVDGQSLHGVPLADAIARMRGAPGTPVQITIKREGKPDEFTVSLTRDTIRRQVLRWSMERDVLVIRLTGFTGRLSESLAKAIADATAQKQPQGVVLDLRGNPGGLLREAVKIADTFLIKGEIVSLRDSTQARQRTWEADAEELLAGLPMVVLIDGRSASASELVADALQHSGRATVMGQRSFGKGSVQTTFPLGEAKGALKLTTSTYHGPSGETVHRVGVTPDIELATTAKVDTPEAGAARPAVLSAREPRVRIDPARCAAAPATDATLACALAFLQSSGVDAFAATHGH